MNQIIQLLASARVGSAMMLGAVPLKLASNCQSNSIFPGHVSVLKTLLSEETARYSSCMLCTLKQHVICREYKQSSSKLNSTLYEVLHD